MSKIKSLLALWIRWLEIKNLQARVKYHFKNPEHQSVMAHYVGGDKYYCHIWKDSGNQSHLQGVNDGKR